MPAASEAVGAPAAAGDDEQEFEICNDEGFVYKVPRGLYPDATPSSTQAAAGPDPEAAGLRRRRRALLRLRAKRLRQLSRWEALASEVLAPLPAPHPPAPQSPPASSHPAAAAAPSSASVIDELLAQVDIQAELIKKAWQWCEEANALCDAHEAAMVDSIVALPLCGGEPAELMASLCSPDEKTAPDSLDEGRGCQAAVGMSSAAVERTKDSGCLQLGHNEKSCCETTVELGHDLPPPILTGRRGRKKATNPSATSSVVAQASIKSKREKASGSASTPPVTPGSSGMRRNAASTPAKGPDTICSPGPLTRRRAAAQTVSPGGL